MQIAPMSMTDRSKEGQKCCFGNLGFKELIEDELRKAMIQEIVMKLIGMGFVGNNAC